MTHPLLDRLAAGPILADGAIGTMLYAAGASLDESFDALNLSRPELVLDTHRAYLDAGADLLETNSFGANRFKLEAFGLAARVREINKKAVRLAREAREIAGRPALIAGSIGPTGRTLAPFGVVSSEAVRAAFHEQIEALLEGGVDLLVLETIGSLDEMTEAVAAAREACDLPIVASMTFAEDGRTIGGSSPEEVAARLYGLGVAVIGANCSVGPQRLLRDHPAAHGGDARGPRCLDGRTRRWSDLAVHTRVDARQSSHAHPGCAGARSAKGTQSDQGARWSLSVAGSGCRFHQRRRFADGPCADERLDHVLSHSAPHRGRDDPALHHPRSLADGIAVGIVGGARGRCAQHHRPHW